MYHTVCAVDLNEQQKSELEGWPVVYHSFSRDYEGKVLKVIDTRDVLVELADGEKLRLNWGQNLEFLPRK